MGGMHVPVDPPVCRLKSRISMPNIPEVDGYFSPGDRRLTVWKRRLAQTDRRIQAAVDNLHANHWTYVSVSHLARSVNMSRWHFSHLFKAKMAQSPSLYMRTLRMQEAQRILSETFLSVKEISTMLGNIDRSHFSREFKVFCGLSPTEFRKRLNASQPQDPTRYASK
jgi:transcriptional regulator GlxA family with amidase domain